MYLYRRFLLAVAAVAGFSLTPLSADSIGLGIEVSPAKLDISAAPGGSFTFPITVHNSAVDQSHVQATMVDFGVGPDGAYQYQKVGTRPYSLMRWATINPREFDLPASTSQQIVFTLAIPEDSHLSGEYAGIVFFQTRPIRRGGQSLAFAARVASKIYETIPGTVNIDGAITKMSSAASPQGQVYRVLFKNTGNAHVYLHDGKIVVQKGGQQVAQLVMEDGLLVERGGERLIQISGKTLQPGSYQATATLDYGGKTETGGQITFTVP